MKSRTYCKNHVPSLSFGKLLRGGGRRPTFYSTDKYVKNHVNSGTHPKSFFKEISFWEKPWITSGL